MVTWHNELSLEGYVILKPNINKIKSMKMPVLMCELLTNNFPPNKKWKWFQQRRGNIFCGIDGTFLIMMIISEKYIHIKKNTDPPPNLQFKVPTGEGSVAEHSSCGTDRSPIHDPPPRVLYSKLRYRIIIIGAIYWTNREIINRLINQSIEKLIFLYFRLTIFSDEWEKSLQTREIFGNDKSWPKI